MSIIILAELCVLVFRAVRPGEPVYEGKTLTKWLEYANVDLPTGEWHRETDPDYALRHIGTNAIPYLIDILECKDSKTKKLLQKVLPLKSANSRYSLAYNGFAALGAMATNAIPDLVRLMHDPDTSEESAGEAASSSLTAIGSNSVPALIMVFAETNTLARIRAAQALGGIQPPQQAAILPLSECLKDPDLRVRSAAAFSLGRIGRDHPAAAQALADHVKDSNSSVRLKITMALGECVQHMRIVVPALCVALGDSEERVRRSAVDQLAKLNPDANSYLYQGRRRDEFNPAKLSQLAKAPEVKAAVEALLGLFRADGVDFKTRYSIGYTLAAIDPEAAKPIAPDLVAMWEQSVRSASTHVYNPDARLGEMLSEVIPKLGSASVQPVLDLLKKPNLEIEYRAMSILLLIGPEARLALPELRSLSREFLSGRDTYPAVKLKLANLLHILSPEEDCNDVVQLVIDAFGKADRGLSDVTSHLFIFISQLNDCRGELEGFFIEQLDKPARFSRVDAIFALGLLEPDAILIIPRIKLLCEEDRGCQGAYDRAGRAVYSMKHSPIRE